jgi:histidinol-phosphatase (PHP family)
MEQTCARAVQLGLRSVAFTDHADFTGWSVLDPAAVPAAVPAGGLADDPAAGPGHARVGAGGIFMPPPLDLDGYRASVERCRGMFPELDILFGVELGEPHWHREPAADLLRRGAFDLVLCSMHSLPGPTSDRFVEIGDTYRERTAGDVVRDYLAEAARMIDSWDSFDVLAHIDYPVRTWPAAAGPYRPEAFEDDYRAVLRALAGRGRALEVNTRVPLDPVVVAWWHEEGGTAVTFGSDAHDPLSLASGFTRAAAMVESVGFRSGAHRHDFWLR